MFGLDFLCLENVSFNFEGFQRNCGFIELLVTHSSLLLLNFVVVYPLLIEVSFSQIKLPWDKVLGVRHATTTKHIFKRTYH